MVDLERSGQVFIAYKGTEFNQSEIENALLKICPDDYSIKCISNDKVIFAKIVFYKFKSERDPFWNRKEGIITVNGYNQDELARANKVFSFYNIEDIDRYHMLTNYMYRDYRNDMFKALSSHMHFCSAIYDKNADYSYCNLFIDYGLTEYKGKIYTFITYKRNKFLSDIFFKDIADIILKNQELSPDKLSSDKIPIFELHTALIDFNNEKLKYYYVDIEPKLKMLLKLYKNRILNSTLNY